MDAELFRLPTRPNFYAAAGTTNPFDVDGRGARSQVPAPDSRFPGYAARMEDARLVTDYRNHCSRNVPAGKQFATKEWMTKNALEIIHLSRRRQAEQSGAMFGVDPSVVPPPEAVVDCTKYACSWNQTYVPGGIGVERAREPVPGLFGTWDAAADTKDAPRPFLSLTTVYEGGRNTPRGAPSPQLR
jgi:hypothetical protein